MTGKEIIHELELSLQSPVMLDSATRKVIEAAIIELKQKDSIIKGYQNDRLAKFASMSMQGLRASKMTESDDIGRTVVMSSQTIAKQAVQDAKYLMKELEKDS